MKRKKAYRRRKKTQKRRVAIRKRKLTAADAQNVRILADLLGALLPLSGFRSSFSLNTIAKEFKLTKYLSKKAANKKESFSEFLEDVICYKPRTLKKIIRKILPPAIEKRHRQGIPVLEPEVIQLSNQLMKLSIDMRKEILDLNLPKERPRIVPPPIEIQKMLENFKLHPVLLPDCQQMFLDGHINESVRKALERFEKHVQDISSCGHLQGAELIGHTLNEKTPCIKLNSLTTPSDKNMQEGYKLICMGLMRWWRNTLSHGDEAQLPHHEAVGRLILVSNLFKYLEDRIP